VLLAALGVARTLAKDAAVEARVAAAAVTIRGG
jgi:hypothetical protein